MRRRANPRRPRPANRGPGKFAASAMIAALALGWAGAARAEDPTDSVERNKGARTVVGAQDSITCANAAAQGVFDDESLLACDRAIGTERLNRANRIATLTNRGAIHLRRRDGEKALADFDSVIALQQRNAEAHLNRGAALVLLKRPGPAVAAITTALSYGVSSPHKAYFNRAAAREVMGDVRGAYEDYNTALTIQPDWGVAEAELARFARGRRERLASQLGDSTAASAPQ
jgi:tetratricopeptide (TPR) repeat protein